MNRIPAKIKLAFSLVVPALLLLPGCAGASHTVAVPYLPPAYYDCSAIDLTSLQNMFYFMIMHFQLLLKSSVRYLKIRIRFKKRA